MMLFIVAAAVGTFCLLCCILFYLWQLLLIAVPREDRSWRYPLPRALRMIWPAVRFMECNWGRRYPQQWLASAHRRLTTTGMTALMNERQFVSLSLFCALAASSLAGLAMLMLPGFYSLLLAPCAIAGMFYPCIWLRNMRAENVKSILRHLPIYLDLLSMAVSAGSKVTAALEYAVDKGPSGLLQHEFKRMLHDMESGLSRAEALRRMEQRVRIKQITHFSNAVIQAERMGSGLANTLKFQAERRRCECFQRAERQAMEVPVKLIFPLLVFILPVTLMVLAFPVVIQFMQEGIW
ncbi:type II secretion system F family protein [Paraherbaspirillum soli]|uniref:Type II secretion system F family protein n=1 Tax=Paraherbaspirillum soli TaxID=631222 RepID=A0ABW0MF56_9BURK